MKSANYKLSEFCLLFILLPVSLVIPYPVLIKTLAILAGFIYVIFVLFKIEKVKFKINKPLNWISFCKRTLIRLFFIATTTIIFVYFNNEADLFAVVVNNPSKWVLFLGIYSILSVYPQELIYRTFYFARYQTLFNNKKWLLLVNAAVFSLAHLFFKSPLVILLTFVGGVFFAITFIKTKSTLLVCIEHAIFGCWLYTVGMGGMLGFPS